jgi:hypothetical protein
MKTIYTKYIVGIFSFEIAIVSVISLGISMQSCSKDDKYNNTTDVHAFSVINQTWQDNLSHIIADTSIVSLSEYGLKLLNYKLFDGVTTSGYINYDLNNNDLIPIYNDSTDINYFELVLASDINNYNHSISKELYSQWKRNAITKVSHFDLKVVILTWSYKGKLFTTQCIVSDNPNSFVYDDILSNIGFVVTTPPKIEIRMSHIRLKNENENDNQNNGTIEKIFDEQIAYHNQIGLRMALATVKLVIRGTRSQIQSHEIYHNASANRSQGWQASSTIRVINISGNRCTFTYDMIIQREAHGYGYTPVTVARKGGGGTYVITVE